ncbi:MAG: hypothetical protein E3J64_03955 [Anaerolineales bacterium]|nr:MAG: hypothetical protein E3J64_03955 [Anaerolineales bacterium]
MKTKVLAVAIGLALVSCGCSLLEEDATPTVMVAPTFTPADGEGPTPGLAHVESIEILILESFPVQIRVVATGNHPDGCTTIDDVSDSQDGNTFLVTITTVRPGSEACTEALVPFEETISLDVYGLSAGVYTVDVNGITDTFELTVDNVAQPQEGSIGGTVWHDLCASPWGPAPPTPPEGCVELPGGGYQANGVFEAGEPGIAGVVVNLGAGACPSTGAATTTTAANGTYSFTGLAAGTYCVSVDALDPTNETILIPGGWTSPAGDGTVSVAVTVAAGEDRVGVDFGWDYQFLPAPQEGSIGGTVWHDLCAPPWGDPPPTPPEGCVVLPDGGYLANGVLEAGEPGLAGVVVTLGAGACPSTGVATTTTAANGTYSFTGLAAGTYCVSVDALDATNVTILIPGTWTNPPAEVIAGVTVNLAAGEDNLGVNFGWDFQSAP